MTLAAVRALFETELSTAFGAMVPAVPVVFDNVQETPPGDEYVIVNLTYATTTQPILCPTESDIETLSGTVQVSCYTPRQQGMLRLEQIATTAMATLNGIRAAADTDSNVISASVGSIEGPVNIVNGEASYALATVAAPFRARV